MGQVTDDHGDGLGMLVLDEGEDVLAFSLLDEREGRLLDLGLNLLDDLLGDLGIQRVLQEHLGIVQTALLVILAGKVERIELFDDLLDEFGGHITQRGEGASDVLDHFRGQLAEQRTGRIVIDGEQENGGPGYAVNLIDVLGQLLSGPQRHGFWEFLSGTCVFMPPGASSSKVRRRGV